MIDWVLAGGALLLMKKPAETYGPERVVTSTGQGGGDGPRPFYTTIGSLPDVRPESQSGNYKRDYDDVFYEIGVEGYGVPFALLKAHAIKESSLNRSAFRQEPNGKASYGLMQVLWWKNSNRFKNWGFPDDMIGDGSLLYDPQVNVAIACEIILDNYSRLKNLRDSINAYNTGVKESVRIAPYEYVDKVLNYYSTIIGRQVL